VLVNLKDVEDEAFQKKTGAEAEVLARRAHEKLAETLAILEKR
jgi:formiminotetrahydrofolate cyclodeaminase